MERRQMLVAALLLFPGAAALPARPSFDEDALVAKMLDEGKFKGHDGTAQPVATNRPCPCVSANATDRARARARQVPTRPHRLSWPT